MAYKLHYDRQVCYFCGVRNPPKTKGKKFRSLIEVHHIVERNEGGTNEPSNLVPCCSNCHSKVHLEQIHIDRWYNVGYAYKLKWTDESGTTQMGPIDPLPLASHAIQSPLSDHQSE